MQEKPKKTPQTYPERTLDRKHTISSKETGKKIGELTTLASDDVGVKSGGHRGEGCVSRVTMCDKLHGATN